MKIFNKAILTASVLAISTASFATGTGIGNGNGGATTPANGSSLPKAPDANDQVIRTQVGHARSPLQNSAEQTIKMHLADKPSCNLTATESTDEFEWDPAIQTRKEGDTTTLIRDIEVTLDGDANQCHDVLIYATPNTEMQNGKFVDNGVAGENQAVTMQLLRGDTPIKFAQSTDNFDVKAQSHTSLLGVDPVDVTDTSVADHRFSTTSGQVGEGVTVTEEDTKIALKSKYTVVNHTYTGGVFDAKFTVNVHHD